MFCSTLGAGAPVPSSPNDGGGGPAAVTTARYIAPMLGESNIISSTEVPGLLPGVSLVTGGGGIGASSTRGRVVVEGEAMEEVEVEEEEERV